MNDAVPAFAEWAAPAHWQAIDFISDLHLARGMPRTFDAWATHLESTPADAVLMLGDLFEVWVGDDARASGFERECTEVLMRAARLRTLGFMAGNRDFLVGATLLGECGVVALADPTVVAAFGARALITHGDALCIGDIDYQRFRAEVRRAAWQQRFLGLPLDERRTIARSLRDASEARRRASPVPADVDVDAALAAEWLARAAAPVLVHRHTHPPGRPALPRGGTPPRRSARGHEHTTGRADVLRWTRDGFARVAPATRRH